MRFDLTGEPGDLALDARRSPLTWPSLIKMPLGAKIAEWPVGHIRLGDLSAHLFVLALTSGCLTAQSDPGLEGDSRAADRRPN